MAFIDLTDMSLYYYLAAGGGVVALLAMFAHSTGGPKARRPRWSRPWGAWAPGWPWASS